MSRSWSGPLPYFPESEIACKGTGVIKIDVRFTLPLLALRFMWSEPFTISSLCRTPHHNRAVGGHPNSLHLTENHKYKNNGSMAADVKWRHWSEDKKLRFAKLAWSLGLSVGLHDGFCHVDMRTAVGKEQGSFLYGSSWSGGFGPEEVVA